jgi:hypothetical protein
MLSKHPIEMSTLQNPFHYLNLVVTWVDIGAKYWIDMVDPWTYVRLTNTSTGQYIIFGDRKESLDGTPMRSYPDEGLLSIVRGDYLRVRLPGKMFTTVRITQPRELPILALSKQSNLGLYFWDDAGTIRYDMASVTDTEKKRIRDIQQTIAIDDRDMRIFVATHAGRKQLPA